MTGIFEAIASAVKAKKPISKQGLMPKALREAIEKSKPTVEDQAKALSTLVDAVRRKSEWRSEALCVHILHTTCAHCGMNYSASHGLLLKQANRNNSTTRYTPVTSQEGYEGLPVLHVHRQERIVGCMQCLKPVDHEYPANCAKQLAFRFE